MSWQDKLIRAKFRGVSFWVEGHDLSGGRRVAVHEYPGRNLPYAEDLGAKALEYKVQGYILGAEYQIHRDDMIDALSEDGVGELHHPYLGVLSLQVKSWSIKESNSKNGYVDINIDFVDPGVAREAAGEDPVYLVSARLDDFQSACSANLPFSLATISQIDGRAFVLKNIRDFLATPLRWLNAARHGVNQMRAIALEIETLRNELQSIAATPTLLIGRTMSLWRGIGQTLTVAIHAPKIGARLTTASRTFTRPASASLSALASVMPTSEQARLKPTIIPSTLSADDARATNHAIGQARVVQSMAVIMAMGALIARAQFPHQAELTRSLTLFRAACESALQQAPAALPDAVFQSLHSLMEAVSAQAIALHPPIEESIMLAKPMPASALAQKLGANDEDMQDMNAVFHPLWVSGKTLFVVA